MSLYKYVTAARFDILKNARIRFTPPEDLNDPFEMKPYFNAPAEDNEFLKQLEKARAEITEEALQHTFRMLPVSMQTPLNYQYLASMLLEQSSSEGEDGWKHMLPNLLQTAVQLQPEIRKLVQHNMTKQIGVLCLTEKPDNLLMWAHYSQNHTGFVLEFDETHDFFQKRRFPDDEAGYLRKVVYTLERPTRPTMIELTSTDLFLTKGKDWEYEQEWRVLRLMEEADTVFGMLPLFSLPPSCLSGIIFGCRMETQQKQDIINFLAADTRYAHIKKSHTAMSETQYKLDIVPYESVH